MGDLNPLNLIISAKIDQIPTAVPSDTRHKLLPVPFLAKGEWDSGMIDLTRLHGHTVEQLMATAHKLQNYNSPVRNVSAADYKTTQCNQSIQHAACVWEIAIKYGKGRLELPEKPEHAQRIGTTCHHCSSN
ncbi:MAG: type II toxin-antitoxin system VapC family toxin [Chloroflexi bacterium]|nr:type II toxin-antitoxin system VapC family toxin [Chloroflexota bacterium]